MKKRASFNRRRAERAARIILQENDLGECGLALNAAGFLDVEFYCGVARGAYVIDGKFVVKVPYEDCHNDNPNFKALVREYKRIQKFRKTALFRYNVPETYLVHCGGRVAMIQECVPIFGNLSDRELKRYVREQNSDKFHDMADLLNSILRIYDFHSDNVGLRRIGKRCIPVFIDLDYSSSCRIVSLPVLRKRKDWNNIKPLLSKEVK